MLEQDLQRVSQIMKYLQTNLSLTFEQSLGFGANIFSESHGDPHQYNSGEKNYTGKSAIQGSGYGAGIVQWSAERKPRLQKLMNKYSAIETWSLEDQCKALVLEINSYFKTFLSGLKAKSNADDACVFVLMNFELNHSKTSVANFVELEMKNHKTLQMWVGPELSNFKTKTWEKGGRALVETRCSFVRLLAKYLNQNPALSEDINGILVQPDLKTMGEAAFTLGQVSAVLNKNQYPKHDYITFSEAYQDLFKLTNSETNTLQISAFTKEANKDITTHDANIQGRIYSLNDATIVLDELSLPADYDNDTYISKNVSNEYRRIQQRKYDRLSATSAAGKKTNKPKENSSTN